MLKIFLARHGQNEDNANGILNGHRDLPLTTKGREQAEELAMKIKDSGIVFEKIYCSPLIRAKETAEIVARRMGLDTPEVLPDLIERDFGIMAGQHVDTIEAECAPDILKTDTITYFLKAKDAENFAQLVSRAKKVISFLKEKYSEGNILLVGHGDMGKMILAAYFDLPWKEVLTMFHFGNSELLELSEESTIADFHKIKIDQHNH